MRNTTQTEAGMGNRSQRKHCVQQWPLIFLVCFYFQQSKCFLTKINFPFPLHFDQINRHSCYRTTSKGCFHVCNNCCGSFITIKNIDSNYLGLILDEGLAVKCTSATLAQKREIALNLQFAYMQNFHQLTCFYFIFLRIRPSERFVDVLVVLVIFCKWPQAKHNNDFFEKGIFFFPTNALCTLFQKHIQHSIQGCYYLYIF